MKPAEDPMSLDDLAELLLAAAHASNHRRFVIAGSLSVMGAVMVPPRVMVMSRDLDMYPELDPDRGFQEIASQLGENSAFHQAHGFYADPITPRLLALPDGWDRRLAPIPLKGGVIAMFIEPNDIAIGKLLRGADNDMLWIEAGIDQGILNPETIWQRTAFLAGVDFREVQLIRSRLVPYLTAPALPEEGQGSDIASPMRPPR